MLKFSQRAWGVPEGGYYVKEGGYYVKEEGRRGGYYVKIGGYYIKIDFGGGMLIPKVKPLKYQTSHLQ